MNVLAFFAHPDDETVLAGGTLALLAQNQAMVHYLCATRGEGGEVGEPPLCTRQELGRVREREMECAVQHLGGSGLIFLDYIDPLIGEGEKLHPYSEDLDTLVGKVVHHIQRLKPAALITHGSNGEYGHPAHVLTYQASCRALLSMGAEKPVLYTISPTFADHPRPRLANSNDPAHLVLDITPVIERKTQAALCHRTQHALFVRRSSKEAGRALTVPEVLMRIEGLHRAHPPVIDGLDDPVAELLHRWVFMG
ncbi:MAG: PIG-L deacetylase family protein [Anaerolineales bacterium]|jgi:LmbE family N-acetylglucosaminyl deacetylase